MSSSQALCPSTVPIPASLGAGKVIPAQFQILAATPKSFASPVIADTT